MTIDDNYGGAPAHPRRRARALARVRIITAIDDNDDNSDNNYNH